MDPSSAPGLLNAEVAQSVFDAIPQHLCRHFPRLSVSRVHSKRYDLKSTEAADPGDAGRVQAAVCLLTDANIIKIQCLVARVAGNARSIAGPSAFLRAWGTIDGPVKALPVRCGELKGDVELWVELEVHARPLTPIRDTALASQIERIQTLALNLASSITSPLSEIASEKAFAPFKDRVATVLPLEGDIPEDHRNFAREVLDYITGGICVALEAPYPAIEDYCRSLIASAAPKFGLPVGRVKVPAIGGDELANLADRVPGVLMVESKQLQLGVQTYQRSATMESLMARLQPIIWTGSQAQLQILFQGGQGDTHDPLSPAVMHAPSPSLDKLTQHAVQAATRGAGGVPPVVQKEIATLVKSSLESCGQSDHARLIPVLAEKAAHVWSTTGKPSASKLETYAKRVGALSETLAGLTVTSRARRCEALQDRLMNAIAGGKFLAHLRQHLFCQDIALDELVRRLRAEVLTRDPSQPIRFCLQGAPGCGKSQSAVLLASILEIPYVNVDVASMGDHHTAYSQLLGSARGIVHSEKCGRLEEASNHRPGAVIEISDLDHAPHSVRAAMGDIFLQALETGEAQSAMGNTFSCCNLLFVFTMNLPNGADESVRKRIGFSNSLTRGEIRDNVTKQIKEMISSAFLSRVGTPILFDPLDGEALIGIAENSVISSSQLAADRLGLKTGRICLDRGVSEQLVSQVQKEVAAFGARALIELCQQTVADVFEEFEEKLGKSSGSPLRFKVASDGSIRIQVNETAAITELKK